MNKFGFYFGLFLFFIFMFFIAISSIIEGMKGLSGKKMELVLKDSYTSRDNSDSAKGAVGIFFGILYFLFGLFILGAIGVVIMFIFNTLK